MILFYLRQLHFTKRRVYHWVFTLLFGVITTAPAATNWVDGVAYGTNHHALATAAQIQSKRDGDGSVIIEHEATTDLILQHQISGFIKLTNPTNSFTVTATGATISSPEGIVFIAQNATNLTITGGTFTVSKGSGGGSGPPPIPGRPQPTNTTAAATAGLFLDSQATISDAHFVGINNADGFTLQHSTVEIQNGTFAGGSEGGGLIATDRSSVIIQDGNFTGGVQNVAFYLENSDATVYGGNFVGNVGSSDDPWALGDGLSSIQTGNTTNHVDLQGGTFSSIAFYTQTGSVQQVTIGASLIVKNGIQQISGTVLVDNQNNEALKKVFINNGTLRFANDYILLDEGYFSIGDSDSLAQFSQQITLDPYATMDIHTGVLKAHHLIAEGYSTNQLTITESDYGKIQADTARFKEDAILLIDASAASISSSGTNSFALISTQTNQLFAGDSATPATEEDFKNNVTVSTIGSSRTRFIDLQFETSGDQTLVQFDFSAYPLALYWGLSNGTSSVVTEAFANDIDRLAGADMLRLIDQSDAATSLSQIETSYFTTFNTYQISLQGLQAAMAQSTSRSTEFRDQLKLFPTGAKGPIIAPGNDWRGWGKYYGQFIHHNANGLNPEYDATLHGGVIGVDHSFGNLLIGLSGGAGGYRNTTANHGEENGTAYHGTLYSTYGTDHAYFDAAFAYGYNRVKTKTAEPFVLNGAFNAQLFSAYFSGGYDWIANNGLVITPEASLQYSAYMQDAYKETSTSSIPREIDAFDADSLRSRLGVNFSTETPSAFKTFAIKLDGRLHWLHEFNPESDALTFKLAGSNNDYQLTYPLLDEEIFQVGFGFSFFNTMKNRPKNILLRFDFDELFGDGFNSHNVALKLIYAF